jgi:hypothetical protein
VTYLELFKKLNTTDPLKDIILSDGTPFLTEEGKKLLEKSFPKSNSFIGSFKKNQIKSTLPVVIYEIKRFYDLFMYEKNPVVFPISVAMAILIIIQGSISKTPITWSIGFVGLMQMVVYLILEFY